jgi:hypothetical protein
MKSEDKAVEVKINVSKREGKLRKVQLKLIKLNIKLKN